MKKIVKATLVLAMLGCSSLAAFPAPASMAEVDPATQVNYQSGTLTVSGKSKTCLKNWGTRGEVSTFLTTYAKDYYKGNYTYGVLSAKSGGTGKEDAPNSALYAALKQTMIYAYTYAWTGREAYQETRYWYKYTDCVNNDDTQFSSFYSGTMHSSEWDAGVTWNREHTWPNSKGLDGQDENDIMMLRPTISTENSNRGNKAYGESSGFFNPNVNVHGDCARIVLYNYTRWGNTAYMWGDEGVMENLDILLKWMEEDPVDTWEMARNDVVQSITGTRNAFIDYPEYAWLLFGREIPDDMTTPSGIAKGAAMEDSSVQDGSSVSGEDSSIEKNSSVEVSGEESSLENESREENSSVEESSEEISATESADEESASTGESESASGAELGIGAMLSGCQSSLGGLASGAVLTVLGACVLKKRKLK